MVICFAWKRKGTHLILRYSHSAPLSNISYSSYKTLTVDTNIYNTFLLFFLLRMAFSNTYILRWSRSISRYDPQVFDCFFFEQLARMQFSNLRPASLFDYISIFSAHSRPSLDNSTAKYPSSVMRTVRVAKKDQTATTS